MVSRKTQLAWMAAGGALCLFTIIVSLKVREGNRVEASPESALPPVVPLPTAEKPPEKPPDQLTPPATLNQPLPDIERATEPPLAPTTTSTPTTTVGSPPVTSPTAPPKESLPSIPPALLQAVSPAPTMPATASPSPAPSVDVTPPSTTPLPPPSAPTEPPSATTIPPPSITTTVPPSTLPPAPPMEAPVPRELPVPRIILPTDPPQIVPPPAVQQVPYIERVPGEPPLAPPPGTVQHYQVRQGGEFLSDIAHRTLGKGERVIELVRLNPTLPQDSRVSGGTTVRLPSDACVQPEEIDTVKPLPALKPVKFETVKPKVLMPLTGTFPCNLDDHRALQLPKAIRDQFGAADTLMVSPGPDHCLWLTNQEHLDRMAEKMEKSQAKEADVRTFKRLYFAQTEKVMMQDDGRVIISDRLAQFAGLRQEVVVVGIDDHFELWDVAKWKEFTQKKSAAARANMSADQD